jgi:Xaa-Pro aminopeptidase
MSNIERIKSLFLEYNIDSYLIPSTDEYLGEYTTEHSNRLKYVTEFSGSNGIALINSKGKNYFFTDGRYMIQAKNELNNDFEICEIAKYNLKTHLSSLSNLRVGFCPKMHSALQIKNLDFSLVPIEESLVDIIWDQRPKREYSDIFLHDSYAGESTKSKIGKLLESMISDGVETYVITDPHAVCWLLNIRGRDLIYTPIILAFAILYKNGHLSLFSDNAYDQVVKEYFDQNNVSVFSEKMFVNHLANLKKVVISEKSSYWFEMLLPNALKVVDYCDKLKCIKNKTELEGAIFAHKKDGRAVSKLLNWINNQNQEFKEMDIVDKVMEFRQHEKGFICPSFPTIAGFNSNGAIIHYRPQENSNKVISENGILLIDSGGQYLEGTTDITRTIAIGTPTEEQIHNFTLVLKGMISVVSAKFPIGTTGTYLDKLARQYLITESKDYAHGTGHGVGSFLSVHEGPQAIANSNNIALEPGMILSIEPGFYKEGEYGIRIENLAYIKKVDGLLEFEVLTLVPIDETLINFSMLTEEETKWLNKYQSLSLGNFYA